jgi:glycosyltransferase involved in cell wall biosynthesis
MRICYVADGRYIHSHRWLRFFSSRGHAIHFISFQPMAPHHVAAVRQAGAEYHGELGPFHLKRFWRTFRDLRRLREILRRERIDVLHCHFLGVNAWYASLSRFHPVIVTVMGGDLCGPDWHPRGGRERLFVPLALRQADLVTCWSRQLAGLARRYCRPNTPIEVIHGGIDLERFCPGPKPRFLQERWNLPPRGRVIFSPRLVRPLYNIHRLADAAKRLCAACPNTYFLFAVPDTSFPAYLDHVRDLLHEDGVAERIRFVGAIPHAEIADYYRLADVTVSIPSTDGTPMSVLESMACGTPVVVSDIPDYDPQYIEPGKTVLAARADDAGSVADALLRVLQEPARARELAMEGQRRVQATGSYEAQMSRMEQLYERVWHATTLPVTCPGTPARR